MLSVQRFWTVWNGAKPCKKNILNKRLTYYSILVILIYIREQKTNTTKEKTIMANTNTLIPASNFEFRNLKGLQLHISATQWMPLSGFGIYDKTAEAFVRFPSSKVKVLGEKRFYESPYSLRRKKRRFRCLRSRSNSRLFNN